MTNRIVAVNLVDRLEPISPVAFRAVAAAAYIGISANAFNRIAAEGAIPWVQHVGHVHRLFLKDDLDAYLAKLPKQTGPPPELRGITAAHARRARMVKSRLREVPAAPLEEEVP